MERVILAGVSADVLDAVARALQLDEAEAEHLHDLARAAAPTAARRRTRSTEPMVHPTLHCFLESITGTPVWVCHERMHYVAGNTLGEALFTPIFDDVSNRRNNALFRFLSPAARNYYVDWDFGADSIVAGLRIQAGRTPHDKN